MKRTFLLAMFVVACGGSNTPADSPSNADTTASSSSPDNSAAPSDSSSPAPVASAAPADSSPAAPAASSAATPPPAAGFGTSDCGKCVNAACDKPLTACNADSACTAQPPHLQSCTGAPKDCIGNAMEVSSLSGKPQKLYGAYIKCLNKASASKACKAQCSQ